MRAAFHFKKDTYKKYAEDLANVGKKLDEAMGIKTQADVQKFFEWTKTLRFKGSKSKKR